MDFSQLEFHDANLLGVASDPVGRTVEIRLAYYANNQSPERILGTLRFKGVRSFNQLMDLELMEDHAKFGNVSNWISGEKPGVSYLHLTGGLITVTAASVEFVSGV